jgi:glutamate synthase domain-containing protein 3
MGGISSMKIDFNEGGIFDYIVETMSYAFKKFPTPITTEELNQIVEKNREEMGEKQKEQSLKAWEEFDKRWTETSPGNMRKKQQEWLSDKLAQADERIRHNKPLGP